MAAPSIVTVFDDVFRLAGFLKSCGVLAFFDVAFGAELTVRSYLEYAREANPRIIIAQPCSAIVNYCEMYAPGLLKYLAPVHSPMLHAAIMIKNYYPEYAGAKIAAISPCVAKKREFEETGYIDFNVTMTGLKSYLEKKNIDINGFDPCDFDGPMPERAVSFSSPGGLKTTILRDATALAGKIRQVEGTSTVYKYLDSIPVMLEEGVAPFIVDCLSCSAGCNGGPGTPNFDRPVDSLENRIEERLKEQTRRNRHIFGNRIKGEINRFWKPGLYGRSYKDCSENLSGYRIPTEKDLNLIYYRMKKTGESDFLNCAACGYGSCRGMAEAIFNGLNRPENCHLYLKKEVDERLHEHRSILEYVREGIFLLDSGWRILPSYSKALEEIFRRDMLAGLPVMEIFSGFFSKEKLKEIEAFLDEAFDISVPYSEIQNAILQEGTEASFVNLDGGFDKRLLYFAVERIGDEKTVQKLLVIVRDGSASGAVKNGNAEKTEPSPAVFKQIEGSLAGFSGNRTLRLALQALAEKCLAFCATPLGRMAPGKAAGERISFNARYGGERLYVSCRHNGAGLDGGKVARAAGEADTANRSERETARLFYRLCLSGITGELKSLSCVGIQIANKKDYCRLDLVFLKAKAAELAIASIE
jgi:hypothetical protein